jgi:hypothetical protein
MRPEMLRFAGKVVDCETPLRGKGFLLLWQDRFGSDGTAHADEKGELPFQGDVVPLEMHQIGLTATPGRPGRLA